MLYACKGLLPNKTAAAAAEAAQSRAHSHGPRRMLAVGAAGAGAQDPNPSQAFDLHSHPGAPYLLILDFTGEWADMLNLCNTRRGASAGAEHYSSL